MSSLASRGGECGGIPLPSRLGGLGEHRELPRGSGAEPQPKTNLVHSRAVRKPLMAIILSVFK